MNVLTAAERVVTTDGIMHLRLTLGGVQYSTCKVGASVPVLVDGPIAADVCKKERGAFEQIYRRRDGGVLDKRKKRAHPVGELPS